MDGIYPREAPSLNVRRWIRATLTLMKALSWQRTPIDSTSKANTYYVFCIVRVPLSIDSLMPKAPTLMPHYQTEKAPPTRHPSTTVHSSTARSPQSLKATQLLEHAES